MNKLWGIMISQVTIFSEELGNDYEVAIRLPGFGDSLFVPQLARELDSTDSDAIIIDGVFENGDVARVILDKNPFPLALVAVRKPKDRPKREFGFGQPSSNEGGHTQCP